MMLAGRDGQAGEEYLGKPWDFPVIAQCSCQWQLPSKPDTSSRIPPGSI